MWVVLAVLLCSTGTVGKKSPGPPAPALSPPPAYTKVAACLENPACLRCHNQSTCEYPDYFRCGCSKSVGITLNASQCDDFRDYYGNAICGMSNDGCVGCRFVLNEDTCTTNQNCEWRTDKDTRRDHCFTKHVVDFASLSASEKLPPFKYDRDGFPCPNVDKPSSGCTCDDSEPVPSNLGTSSELAELFPNRFQKTDCDGPPASQSCPYGFGRITMRCGKGGWETRSWDARKCINEKLSSMAINTGTSAGPNTTEGILSEAKQMAALVKNYWYLGMTDVTNVEKWMKSIACQLSNFTQDPSREKNDNETLASDLIAELGCIVANIQTLCKWKPSSCGILKKGFGRISFSAILKTSEEQVFSPDTIESEFERALSKWARDLGFYIKWSVTVSSTLSTKGDITKMMPIETDVALSLDQNNYIAIVQAVMSKPIPPATIVINTELANNLSSVLSGFDKSLQLTTTTEVVYYTNVERWRGKPASKSLEETLPQIATLLIPANKSVFFSTSKLRIHATTLSCSSTPNETENVVLDTGESRRRETYIDEGCPDTSAELDAALISLGFGQSSQSSQSKSPPKSSSGQKDSPKRTRRKQDETDSRWRGQVSIPLKEVRILRCGGKKPPGPPKSEKGPGKSGGKSGKGGNDDDDDDNDDDDDECELPEVSTDFGVVLTVYKDESLFRGTSDENSTEFSPYLGVGESVAEGALLVSYITSVSLGIESEVLEVPIVLNFENRESENPNTSSANASTPPLCTYWSYDDAAWRSEGGSLLANSDTIFSCSFNHTTNFAVLLDVGHNYGSGSGDDDDAGVDLNTTVSQSNSTHNSSDNTLDDPFESALQILTCVGVGMSVVAYSAVIITFTFFTKLRSVARWILCHMCATLLVGEVVFFVGLMDSTMSELACTSVGVVTHYALLAAFGWMLVDAIYIHTSFTSVYTAYQRDDKGFFRKCVMAVYGVPIVIVGLSVGLTPHPYGDDGHCFLTGEIVWAFAGPVLVVIAINTILFVRIIYTVYTAAVNADGKIANLSESEKLRHEQRIRFKRSLRASLSFFFLMGLGWSFGFFAHGVMTQTAQLVFSLSLVLQGGCIFYFHCFIDSDVRQSWTALLSISSWSSSSAKSQSSGDNDMITNEKSRGSSIKSTSSNGSGGGDKQKEENATTTTTTTALLTTPTTATATSATRSVGRGDDDNDDDNNDADNDDDDDREDNNVTSLSRSTENTAFIFPSQPSHPNREEMFI